MQSQVRKRLLDAFTKSNGEFLSGQYLADLFGCSRTAIWKHMEDLRNEGFELEAVRRKGYRIVSVPEKITPNEIQLGLTTKRLGRQIHYEESVSSTQKIALQMSFDGAPEGTIVHCRRANIWTRKNESRMALGKVFGYLDEYYFAT